MTSVYGLIGKRLVHSFSAAYFNAKFDREGRDARYRLFPIDDIRDVFPLQTGKRGHKSSRKGCRFEYRITK